MHAATPSKRRADNSRKLPPDLAAQFLVEQPGLQPFTADDSTVTILAYVTKHSTKAKPPPKRGKGAKKKAAPPQIGTAAADWARWPAGTTFRLLSTGQIYRVEDYGWALAGRNTIDLYMPTPRAMNSWGAREEPIQVLHWGDPNDSLKLLLPRMHYKHIRRMVLELQGNEEEAAALR